MIRLNITMPEDLVEELKKVENKSQFISQALREKISKIKKQKIEKLLIEGYSQAAKKDKKIIKDWDSTLNDGWRS